MLNSFDKRDGEYVLTPEASHAVRTEISVSKVANCITPKYSNSVSSASSYSRELGKTLHTNIQLYITQGVSVYSKSFRSAFNYERQYRSVLFVAFTVHNVKRTSD